jgi:hypothetical protein
MIIQTMRAADRHPCAFTRQVSELTVGLHPTRLQDAEKPTSATEHLNEQRHARDAQHPIELETRGARLTNFEDRRAEGKEVADTDCIRAQPLDREVLSERG